MGNPGFWKTEYSSRNPESTDDCNRESISRLPLTKNLESSIWNPESTAWNPESQTVLDSITWGDLGMISLDLGDIFAGKFYPNKNTNLKNFRTRSFLCEDGKVGERSWWVPKNWKNVKKVKLMLLLCFFRWRHDGHICFPKQWNGGHVYVPNQPCGSWTLFFM